MKRVIKGLKILSKVCIFIPCALIVLAILLNFIAIVGNNISASNYQQEFCKVKDPDKTYVVDNKYSIGRFGGNGNGTEYLLSMAIQSELSLEDLKDYYSKYGNFTCYVDDLSSGTSLSSSISYDDVITDYTSNHYYIVYSIISAPNTFLYELDIRGH